MSNIQPLVSVCIITYRHAAFIRQCVESALAQETDFPFEIIVGEDESDDGTREICLALATEHPEHVRLVLNRRQDVTLVDGRPRGTNNLMRTLAVARGEFVALCEGDDYWTDAQKLATQVAYLREHTDCVGCFHEATLVDAGGKVLAPEFFKSQVPEPQAKYDRRDCLTKLMSNYPTCSLLYRRAAFGEPPTWYLKRSSDFFFDLVITRHGQLGFIDRVMAAYRRHNGGIWSGNSRVMQHLELISRIRNLIAEPEFYPEFKDELMDKLTYFESQLALASDLNTAKQTLRQAKELIARLAGDREKLLKCVEEQSEMLSELRNRANGTRVLRR